MTRSGWRWNAFSSVRTAKRVTWAIIALLVVVSTDDGRIIPGTILAQEKPPLFGSTAPTATAPGPTPPKNSEAENAGPASKPPAEGEAGEPTEQPNGGRLLLKSEPLDKVMAMRGKLMLRDATLADWMFAIMTIWPVDIAFDHAELQRLTLSGKYTDKTLEDVLNGILPRHGLTYRRIGNGLSIVKQEEAGINLQQETKLIPLKYNSPVDIEPTLRFLLSREGKTQAIPSAEAIMVIDLPENVEQVSKYITALEEMARARVEKQEEAARLQREAEARAAREAAGLDPASDPNGDGVVQTTTAVFRPLFVEAVDIQETIQSQIGDGIVSVVESENTVTISGSKQAVTAAAQLLEQLDVPRRQVKISVMMYDVSVEALEQLGINWRNAGKDRISSTGVPGSLFDVHSAPLALGGSGTAATTSTATTTGTAAAATSTASGPLGGLITSTTPNLVGSAMNIYHVSRHFDISAVLQALHQTDGARLLANPTLHVRDREESEIRIVSEIPVQQLTQTEMGGNIGTTTFREAGITLTVLPEIADDRWVRLNISPEFSALRGFQNGQPIIDRRQATTSVVLANGETLVLGGLRRRNDIETVSGVPGLMNIKYLGNLFRSHRTTVTESELIIFLHAEIVKEGCITDPRHQMALQVATETLDEFPAASHAPFIPNCNDPYCPYHNPPPRPQEEWFKEHPECIHASRSSRPTPHQQTPPVPMDDSSPMQTEPLPPEARRPEPVGEYRATPRGPGNNSFPPPVIVDQTAKTGSAEQFILGRLPRVEPSPANPPAQPQVAASHSPPRNSRVATTPKPTNDPKARLAQTPNQKRPAPKTSPAAEPKKSSWLGEILR